MPPTVLWPSLRPPIAAHSASSALVHSNLRKDESKLVLKKMRCDGLKRLIFAAGHQNTVQLSHLLFDLDLNFLNRHLLHTGPYASALPELPHLMRQVVDSRLIPCALLNEAFDL